MAFTANTATIRIAATIITRTTTRSILTIQVYTMTTTRTQLIIRTTIRVTNTKPALTTRTVTSPTRLMTMVQVMSTITVTK